jgi:hypothetical protein
MRSYSSTLLLIPYLFLNFHCTKNVDKNLEQNCYFIFWKYWEMRKLVREMWGVKKWNNLPSVHIFTKLNPKTWLDSVSTPFRTRKANHDLVSLSYKNCDKPCLYCFTHISWMASSGGLGVQSSSKGRGWGFRQKPIPLAQVRVSDSHLRQSIEQTKWTRIHKDDSDDEEDHVPRSNQSLAQRSFKSSHQRYKTIPWRKTGENICSCPHTAAETRFQTGLVCSQPHDTSQMQIFICICV